MKLHESFETNHEYLSSFLLLLAFERRKAAMCTFFPPNFVSHWRLFLELATHFWLDREAVGLGRPIYGWQASFSHKLWLNYPHYIIFDHHARTHWRSQGNKTCFLYRRRQCGWCQKHGDACSSLNTITSSPLSSSSTRMNGWLRDVSSSFSRSGCCIVSTYSWYRSFHFITELIYRCFPVINV